MTLRARINRAEVDAGRGPSRLRINKLLPLQRKGNDVLKEGERGVWEFAVGGERGWEFEVALRVAAPAILRLPPERSR
jgi:hypothetical protein